MKTSYIKAALVVLSLMVTIVTQAQAQTSDEDREVTEGKIEAAIASDEVDSNHPLRQVIKMTMELNSIAKKINDLQTEVGTSVDDSNGVIKSLADKMLSVEQLQAKFLSVDAEIQNAHGNGLALLLNEAQKIVIEARNVLQAAKEDVKKADEPSEN